VFWAWTSLYLVFSALVVGGWYLWNRQNSRNRAVHVLHWLERALDGHGHVTGIRWLSSSQFEVPVKLASQVFRHPRFLVNFLPREFPLQWLRTKCKNEAKETLTFCADLDLHPRFSMEMLGMRWFARSSKELDSTAPGWTFACNEPLVMTTRLDWEKEVSSAIQVLASCEQRNELKLSFRKQSPHFSATMPLASAEPVEGASPAFFESLRLIAEGATCEQS
jgi:hypothetical protein